MRNEEIMTMKNNDFILPDMIENEFSDEDLSENYNGIKLQFQRIKIPAGGAVQFEIPGDNPENPDYAKNIEGIIVYHHKANVYWPEGSEYDDNEIPVCSSVDGVVGHGSPGGACVICEFNKFGTGVDSKGNPTKGKACKNMRHLYILRNGEYMPVILTLPPTSLKAFNDFINMSFVMRRRPTWSSIIQIGLKRIDNGVNPYSVATFRNVCDLTGSQLVNVRNYINSFSSEIETYLQQQVNDLEKVNAENYSNNGDNYIDDNGHFCISNSDIIDSARDNIPA